MHHRDGLLWIISFGGLAREHDAVRSIQDGITDIADLGTRGTGIVRHRFEHLSGTDDRLAREVALGDHHLLRDEDLSGRDLNAKVTPSDHDSVGQREDLVKVVHSLLVLNLGDDLNILALFAEHLPNRLYVVPAANERGKDHVHVILDPKPKVILILLR